MMTHTSTNGHARRILIVDDQPDITATLTVFLSALGHETRSAHRGREAIWLARLFDPDLVLLDIGLPDISGFEVVHALRANARGESRYIAAVTGRTRIRDFQRALKAGFDYYLSKPLDIAKLRTLLRVASVRSADQALA